MRIAPFVVAFSLIFPYIGILQADAPKLEADVKIQDGGQALQVSMYSAPTAVDWNNDGKKDLLVGQIVGGHIRLYLNQGTDLNPILDGGTLVESDNAPISVSSG